MNTNSHSILRSLLAFAMILMGLVVIAVGQTPTVTTQANDRYRIGPGDVLDIRILNRPQLSREAIRVEGNGMIRMPLIDGEVQAACRTEGELSKEIADRYL